MHCEQSRCPESRPVCGESCDGLISGGVCALFCVSPVFEPFKMRMLSGKRLKLIIFEIVQFACLSVPVFVIMERFASLMRHVRGGDLTAYWLVVAASIAYVTTSSLLVWVPLKYFILTSRRFISEITAW